MELHSFHKSSSRQLWINAVNNNYHNSCSTPLPTLSPSSKYEAFKVLACVWYSLKTNILVYLSLSRELIIYFLLAYNILLDNSSTCSYNVLFLIFQKKKKSIILISISIVTCKQSKDQLALLQKKKYTNNFFFVLK